ncbi:hypothetical protein ACLEPN_19335 [Myxococcus sp. 1LA]
MSSPRCPDQGKPSAHQHRLGPYLLGPRLLTKPEVGRIYIARHQHTGRPALVLWPDPACDDAQPLCPLELRIVTSPGGHGERPFLAVEVARPFGDRASVEEVAEELRDALTDAARSRLPPSPASYCQRSSPRRRARGACAASATGCADWRSAPRDSPAATGPSPWRPSPAPPWWPSPSPSCRTSAPFTAEPSQ